MRPLPDPRRPRWRQRLAKSAGYTACYHLFYSSMALVFGGAGLTVALLRWRLMLALGMLYARKLKQLLPEWNRWN